MMRPGVLCTVVAAALVVAGCSKTESRRTGSEEAAPRSTAVGSGGAGADVRSDAEFVHQVALMNLTQIALSRLAVGRAANSDVKFFAQQMIDEHDAAVNKLKSVASEYPNDWPVQLDDKHKKVVDDLAKKQATDFDREYAKAIVDGQQNLAAELESRLDVQSLADWKTAAAARAQSKALPDPKAEMADVKVRPIKGGSELTMKINQWAADTYPLVQKHLDTARALERIPHP